MRFSQIDTEHGRIAVMESSGKGAHVLLLHGNSACKEVFWQQFDSELGDEFHLIAFDLPGHGVSQDATCPGLTYSVAGFAQVAAVVLQKMEVSSVAMLGWSLGGHIGLEMIGHSLPVTRLMLTGTPPISHSSFDLNNGFHHSDAISQAGMEYMHEDQIQSFACAISGMKVPPEFLTAAVRRADGQARRLVFEHILKTETVDQRHVAEASPVPLAMVNGANDHFVNLDYINSIIYRNLWEGTHFILPHCGHAAFMENAPVFNQILRRFLQAELT